MSRNGSRYPNASSSSGPKIEIIEDEATETKVVQGERMVTMSIGEYEDSKEEKTFYTRGTSSSSSSPSSSSSSSASTSRSRPIASNPIPNIQTAILTSSQITDDEIRKICRKRKDLYDTPQLNDRMYLHYGGYQRIENLSLIKDVSALWLECNVIRKIENLESLTNLRCLFLQNNNITKIEGLDKCTQLVTIDLSNNAIEKVEGLSALTSLDSIMLNHNKLTDISGLIDCPSLKIVNVSNNDITSPRHVLDTVASMPRLQCFYSQNNPFTSESEEIPTPVDTTNELNLSSSSSPSSSSIEQRDAELRPYSHRRHMTLYAKSLHFLDDRPISDADREAAKAWASGGVTLERETRARQARDKVTKELTISAKWKAMRGVTEGGDTHEGWREGMTGTSSSVSSSSSSSDNVGANGDDVDDVDGVDIEAMEAAALERLNRLNITTLDKDNSVYQSLISVRDPLPEERVMYSSGTGREGISVTGMSDNYTEEVATNDDEKEEENRDSGSSSQRKRENGENKSKDDGEKEPTSTAPSTQSLSSLLPSLSTQRGRPTGMLSDTLPHCPLPSENDMKNVGFYKATTQNALRIAMYTRLKRRGGMKERLGCSVDWGRWSDMELSDDEGNDDDDVNDVYETMKRTKIGSLLPTSNIKTTPNAESKSTSTDINNSSNTKTSSTTTNSSSSDGGTITSSSESDVLEWYEGAAEEESMWPNALNKTLFNITHVPSASGLSTVKTAIDKSSSSSSGNGSINSNSSSTSTPNDSSSSSREGKDVDRNAHIRDLLPTVPTSSTSPATSSSSSSSFGTPIHPHPHPSSLPVLSPAEMTKTIIQSVDWFTVSSRLQTQLCANLRAPISNRRISTHDTKAGTVDTSMTSGNLGRRGSTNPTSLSNSSGICDEVDIDSLPPPSSYDSIAIRRRYAQLVDCTTVADVIIREQAATLVSSREDVIGV